MNLSTASLDTADAYVTTDHPLDSPQVHAIETQNPFAVRQADLQRQLQETALSKQRLMAELAEAEESKKRLIDLLNEAAQLEDTLTAQLDDETDKEIKIQLQIEAVARSEAEFNARADAAQVSDFEKEYLAKKAAQRERHRLHRKKIHVCPVCKEGFRAGFLRRHIREVHQSRESMHCVPCNKTFANQYTARRHQAWHAIIETEGKREKQRGKEKLRSLCSVCGMTFENNTKLKIHATVHTGYKA